jgi:hypothetical protein
MMRIDGASGLYAMLGNRPASPASKTTTPTLTSTDAHSSSSASSVGFDFTNMTPNQMKGAADTLYKSGQIDLTQVFMLENAGRPLGKAGPNGEFIPLSASERQATGNTPMNYIQTAKIAISNLEQSGEASNPKSGYQQWTSILATLQTIRRREA